MENNKIARIIAAGCGIGTVAAFTILIAKKKTKGPNKTEHKTAPESVEKKSATVTTAQKEQQSRVENMFGPRETWSDNKTRAPYPNGYKGFLYIECEGCGKERTFYAKNPFTRWKCECGHETALADLRPAYTYCRKCENTLKYMTNLKKDAFSVECRKCGAPIDMERSSKGTEFVPVGMSRKRAKEERYGNH